MSMKKENLFAVQHQDAPRRRRVALVLGGGALLASWPKTNWAQAAPGASGGSALRPLMAVNLSGRQRTLGLRAARCYAQLGLGVLPPQSAQAMRSSVAEFESTQARLGPFCAGKPSARLLAAVASRWGRFAATLREVPDREGARDLSDMFEVYISACSALHDQVVKEVAVPAASAVSAAGRQRFLSQRAAQIFMFREWGLPIGDLNELLALKTEAQQIRVNLRNRAEVTSDARRELDVAETQWIFFDDALRVQMNGRADEVARRNVATTSERLFQLFEKLTLSVVTSNE
jgi:hypothetical protein